MLSEPLREPRPVPDHGAVIAADPVVNDSVGLPRKDTPSAHDAGGWKVPAVRDRPVPVSVPVSPLN